jgi:hypothetical protein
MDLQVAKTVKSEKIDPITEIQDAIDSLSLSLFEALRALRNAVAPESFSMENELKGSVEEETKTSANLSQTRSVIRRSAIDYEDMDYDDFLMAYHEDDPFALELIKISDGKPPKTREEYLKLRAMNEMKIAMNVTNSQAENILSKSAALDDLVAALPGMNRTKKEQMDRIQELLDENKKVDDELRLVYQEAEKKRQEIRMALKKVTCKALCIEQD